MMANVGPGIPVTAVLYDSRHNELSRQELATNGFGTVNGAFELSEGVMLGEYQVRLYAYKVTQWLAIQVEQYRKPDFAVDINLSAERGGRGRCCQCE